ncbi:hypothetical protein F3087_27780 [Nocardia colli]|uniref:WXG100 family type VII secretion target n=1 Tax=Nocardia colli TaxID=2545717 RepID=A0A5N0E7N6_9NOCA|nr:hypothetical protein [Nocardia colli]KAA8885442.1 hypothetical protein F3087_27780 [Nocardia colli]
MTDFTVDVAGLAGFRLDLQDVGTNSSSNATRLLSALTLPVGSSGLIATVGQSLEKFKSAYSAVQRSDLTTIETLGADLSTAATSYRATDDTNATAMNAIGGSGTSSSLGAEHGVSRFTGLQQPNLPDVQEVSFTVRQMVTSAIELISVYDDRMNEAVGIKPAADVLAPLVADWEALQAVGRRIALLGINDYVTSENLIGGTRWLQSKWSGDASQTFGTSANSLGQSVAGRSLDLEAVSKIVENGGACLERLVYNQAAGLTDGILQPMTVLGATFPLGGWAPYAGKTVSAAAQADIRAAVEALKKGMESRQTAIRTVVDRVVQALDYTPGRTVPTFQANDFEIPDKVVVDLGDRKFGFGDNIWWSDNIASAV